VPREFHFCVAAEKKGATRGRRARGHPGQTADLVADILDCLADLAPAFAERFFDVPGVVLGLALVAQLLVVVQLANFFLDLALGPGRPLPWTRPYSTWILLLGFDEKGSARVVPRLPRRARRLARDDRPAH